MKQDTNILTKRKVNTAGHGRGKHIVGGEGGWPDTRNNAAAIHKIACIDERTREYQTSTQQGISHARLEQSKVMANGQTHADITCDQCKYFTTTDAMLEQHSRNHDHHGRVEKQDNPLQASRNIHQA